jgi:hypothetical protein
MFWPWEVIIKLHFNILKSIYKLHLLETRPYFLHNIFTNSALLFNTFKVLLADKGKKTGSTKLLKFLEAACASEDYGVVKK